MRKMVVYLHRVCVFGVYCSIHHAYGMGVYGFAYRRDGVCSLARRGVLFAIRANAYVPVRDCGDAVVTFHHGDNVVRAPSKYYALACRRRAPHVRKENGKKKKKFVKNCLQIKRSCV